MVDHAPLFLVLKRLKEEDDHKFKTSLDPKWECLYVLLFCSVIFLADQWGKQHTVVCTDESEVGADQLTGM